MTEYEQKQIFSNNLKKLMEQSGKEQKQVAFDIGEKPNTFNQWVMGKALPSVPKTHTLADYFNVDFDALVNDNLVLPQAKKKGRKIPVLGRVAAGLPIEMVEDIIDEEEIDPSMIGDYFALKINGDSMEPRICDGDVVIVRQQPDIESGEIAIVTINGNDATCKKVLKFAETIVLLSNNPKYEPIEFTKSQVENLPIRILGKVVELRAKFQ